MYIYFVLDCSCTLYMIKNWIVHVHYIYSIDTIFIIDYTCIHMFLHIRTCVVNAIMFFAVSVYTPDSISLNNSVQK